MDPLLKKPIDNPFNYDPEEIEKEQAAADAEQRRLALIGGIGDNLANRKSFGEFFLGKFAPEQKTGDYFSRLGEIQAKKAQRYKDMLEKYQDYKLREMDRDSERKFQLDRDEAQRKFQRQQDANKFNQDIQMQGIKSANDLAAELAKKDAERRAGKQLAPDKILNVNEGNSLPGMLQDVKAVIEQNKDSFGPISGRMKSINPWDTSAQSIDAQMRASSQAFGRYMEGGVLRKEDEDKYRKMFPTLSDAPEVAKNKLQIVERLLAQKQKSNIEALRGAGYNVDSIDKQLSVPDLPDALIGKTKPKGAEVVRDAYASGGGLKPGTIENGYVYLGGDPANPQSWEKAK